MRELKLTGGAVCLLDDNDYEYLSRWKWQLGKDGYARRTSSRNGKHYTISELLVNAQYELEQTNE